MGFGPQTGFILILGSLPKVNIINWGFGVQRDPKNLFLTAQTFTFVRYYVLLYSACGLTVDINDMMCFQPFLMIYYAFVSHTLRV